ncbi:hypothetical protein [Rubinisphaera italica]|uniref:Uncharacterized protein n=1 Tax=Rubinisphaera italica TaxID=2527969 RepID=A0A5C5XG77_9PLAN|nr:hypothetical protein [Rubinisphaera italica]TWT61669.1 hypothetical protein Pan54_24060 [Rubinisphaera italica]
MDSQQTWIDMLDALRHKKWDEAKELADALYEWIRKGGFPPVTIGDESLGKNWHKTIATFTCLAVANKVDDIRKRRERRQSATKGGD